ncbi:MAG: Crotonyl-CoA carboxylase/reductase, ethylmalonyl-CoA producing, partial [uncultured Nocardioidaceae bacterium]
PQLPLRQLQGGVGGQPPHRQGPDPPDPVEGVPDGGGRPGRSRRPQERPPGQGRRPHPGPRGGPRCEEHREARAAPRGDQPLPRRV